MQFSNPMTAIYVICFIFYSGNNWLVCTPRGGPEQHSCLHKSSKLFRTMSLLPTSNGNEESEAITEDDDAPEIIYTHNHLDESHFSNSFLVFAQLRDENILTDIILKGQSTSPTFFILKGIFIYPKGETTREIEKSAIQGSCTGFAYRLKST